MTVLILGLVLFFVPHSIGMVNTPLRDRLMTRLGQRPWLGLYSLVSGIGLIAIVWGYGLARHDPTVLYMPPAWLRHVNMLLMLPVFPLLLAAYLPGRIRSAVGHPMLAAVKAWALAHLLVNGTLADVMLFGSFLGWAVAERISLKRRPPGHPPALPATAANDLIAVIGGLALYALFVVDLHGRLMGVALIR